MQRKNDDMEKRNLDGKNLYFMLSRSKPSKITIVDENLEWKDARKGSVSWEKNVGSRIITVSGDTILNDR